MSKIRFQIVPPILGSDETVFLSGESPSLGQLDPARAVPLRWEPPFHVGEIEASAPVPWKLLRGPEKIEEVDAAGNPAPLLSADPAHDQTVLHTVADWADRPRGRFVRETAFTRELIIWLPPAYDTEPTRHFPVIVMHEGAQVFDPAAAGVDWAADEWVLALSAEGVLPQAIVVGVCHAEGSFQENISFRDFDLSPEWGGSAYARFLATELLLYLDRQFRTLPNPAARILVGASLGGLLTFYLALNLSGAYGKYACLSTSFEDLSQSPPAHAGQLLALEAMPHLPRETRMYFDYGTHGLDECYQPYHVELGSLLRAKGWREGREFRIVQVKNGSHDMLSWRLRLGDALRFLVST